MITLEKKYRLIWDISTKELVSDPYREYGKTRTLTNSGGYFESDSIDDIFDKIGEEGLIYSSDEEEVGGEVIDSDDIIDASYEEI